MPALAMANQKQQTRSCRSKSCGRKPSKELFTPDQNAEGPHLRGRARRSPARVKELPSDVNKTQREDVRSSSKQVSPTLVVKVVNPQTEKALKEIITEQVTVISSMSGSNSDPVISNMTSTTPEVSDNRGAVQQEGSQADIQDQTTRESAKEDPGKALMLVLAELKDIKTQMVKLHQLESTTASLVGQLATNTSKMGELVETVAQNKSKIGGIYKEMDALKNTVESHNTQLADMQGIKEEFVETTDKAVVKMNELIDTQRDQVDSFNEGAKRLQNEWKEDVMSEVNKKFEDLKKEKHFQSLKTQAFRNRYNLVLIGLPEEEEKTTMQIVKHFISETLKISNVKVNSAHRLGTLRETAGTYHRPTLVKFGNWEDRNEVWKKRAAIPDNKDNKIRIQADLPKIIREGIPTLYKVASAATKSKQFSNVKVQDYQLELNDKTYQIYELEQLPKQFRPSSLAEPKSDTHMVFFSRHSKLSNHYPANFTIKGETFTSMEHFLATRRAKLSGKEEFIVRAQEVRDPVQAKHILNALHGDHQPEWDSSVEQTALEGLRAKFSQNRHLYNHLCDTGSLILGEASPNATWGVGMDINNKEVLDQSKWSEGGNLLGRSLMSIRAEFLRRKEQSSKSSQ